MVPTERPRNCDGRNERLEEKARGKKEVEWGSIGCLLFLGQVRGNYVRQDRYEGTIYVAQ